MLLLVLEAELNEIGTNKRRGFVIKSREEWIDNGKKAT